MASRSMRIGELAAAAGVTKKAIRHYEKEGLLDPAPRTASGYRQYGPKDAERLEFITKAKHQGLSLDEIKDILAISGQRAPCIHVLALLDEKVAQADAVIAELREFREEIAQLRQESQARLDQLPDESQVCGIIVTLAERLPLPAWPIVGAGHARRVRDCDVPNTPRAPRR